MADQENKLLKKIAEIEKILQSKDSEVSIYRNQLFQLSHQLDEMISTNESELSALRQLFQNLVPTELPQINGFEFSRKFVYGTQSGGDYFDLFLNKDKFKWGLLISSAENYTTSALILSQIINHSVVFADKDISVPEKVKKFVDSVAGEFSLFYGQVDRRDLSFDFCCLGKICGIITTLTGDSSNSLMTQIISAESPGEMPGSATSINSIKLNLETKSKVCFVTPGVLEIIPIQKLAAICQTMASQDIHNLRNEILFQLELQSGRAQPLRDQVVFVFEIKENLIKIARNV
jgi:phosphoserine phosphatase RsbU/P